MDRNRDAFRRRRVRASWAILGVAMLLKTAGVGWLYLMLLWAAAIAQGLAAMLNVPPPAPRPFGEILLAAFLIGALFAAFASLYWAAVAAAQRRVLRPAVIVPFVLEPLPGWTRRTAAAVAIAVFVCEFVTIVWNNLNGPMDLAGAIVELVAGSIVEILAIVSVQSQLLESAGAGAGAGAPATISSSAGP